MKHILRHLPFSDGPSTLEIAGETIPIRARQIIVWVSLSIEEVLAKDAPRFPAVLDTGHNHNFSIRERQLTEWAGIQPHQMKQLGRILVNRREVRLYQANLWIYRNRPGTAELVPGPCVLSQVDGIAVHTEQDPRLPLIGTRTLVTNRLRLTVFGKQKATSLVQESE